MERLSVKQWNRIKTSLSAIALGACITAALVQPTIARSEGDDGMDNPPQPNPTEHKFGGPTGQKFGGGERGGPGRGGSGNGGPRPNGQRPMRPEEMMEELDLTPAQQEKVRAIYEQEREQMRAIHEKTRTSVMALLNAEQKAQFEKMPQPGPPRGGQRGGRPGGPDGQDGDGPGEDFRPMGGMQDEDHGRPVALIAKDLGVTPEQFRAAFKKVTPAPRGERPTEAQRMANRKVLSETLGVSPEKLDEVMDRYRPEGPDGPPRPE